jgi:hypothetical protein
MARAEQYSWASLVALVAIFGWFQMRMLDGWTIIDQPASRLFWVYIVVITAATVAGGLIAGAFRLLARGQAVERDERDHAIEARANQNERLFIIVAVNVLIWQALWEGLLGAHSFPRIDITRLPAVVFLLFALLFGGEMVKRVSTIWLYRAQTPRD